MYKYNPQFITEFIDKVIIENSLTIYTTTIFNRWESIRIFFEKNDSEKFYSNFIMLNDLNYIQENHTNFMLQVLTVILLNGI